MKIVNLWKFENGKWTSLNIKMPLDPNSQIAKNWGNSIKNGEVFAFAENSDPTKSNPTKIPDEILNLYSPSQGIRDRQNQSRKLFQNSSEFFIEKTEEILKPEKLSKSKFTPEENTKIYKLLEGLQNGLTLLETGFNTQLELVEYLGKLGYKIKLKGSKYYLCN